MKNFLIAFGIMLSSFVSCENDDFCSKETTPRLIVSFYDNSSPETYKEIPIYAWADKKDSIYKLAVVDSIYLPLNTRSNKTKYLLATSNIIDALNINYNMEDIFVSESCGYKTIFKNLNINITNNWIDRLEIINTTVKDETSSHVKIYH